MSEYANAYAGLIGWLPGVVPPKYGPFLSDIPPIPWFLQCGRCGLPARGKSPNTATIDDLLHHCLGPYPVDTSPPNPPCIGPWFDPCAPAGVDVNKIPFTHYCALCLRPCVVDDPSTVHSTTDHSTMKVTSYVMNDHQLDWTHCPDPDLDSDS